MCYINIIQHYLAIKKNKVCNNKYGPRGHFARCSKSDRERKIWYNFTYMWSPKKKKKIKMTHIRKQRQSHTYREQTGGCQRGGGLR